ncbi:MAG: efflux RND transporter permease subunit [Treponema sp.]|nr:efflux RND transporter permease subunit [Treponema sp.]
MMLSQKTLDHPILVLIVFALLGLMGAFTIGKTEVSLMPDTEYPYLMISASYANAGPESVEKSVTTPLENSLVSLNGLKSITSTSSEGSCRISLEFNYGTDLDKMTNDVRDKLDRVSRSLPDNVSPSIMKMNSSASSIMRISIRGNRTTDDLKKIAEDYILDVLEQADGVGEASVMGGRTKIVRVELEQNRLEAYGLSLSAVSSSLSGQNIELGGGSIIEGTKSYSVRTTGEYKSIDEINDTVVATINGYGVRVSDLGRAYMGYTDASSYVYINGVPGVYISVTKQSGTNSVTVADAVYKKIEEVKAILPDDITLEIVSDETESIRDTLSTLLESAWQGIILAVIVLFVFLCNFKSTIIIGVSIPLSIIITLLCMNFAGITLNMMTMTGLILGVGMIVDASIVMIDNIYAYRLRGTKPKISAILGSQEMMMSIISGNLTTICVFVPFLFFMKDLGMMGQMFKEIIFTIVIALVSSLLVAIFLIPVLAGHFLPLTNRNEKPVKNPVLKFIYGLFGKAQGAVQKIYDRALAGALNHRAATLVMCFSALAIALIFLRTIRIEMMPNSRQSSVSLSIAMPSGTSLEETASVINDFQKIVESEIKGYDTIVASIGGGGGGSSYTGSIQINLPEPEKQVDTDNDIRTKLRAHFNDYTDVTFNFGRGMRQQMSGDDINIAVKSASLDQALEVANKIADIIEANPNLGEASIDTSDGLPQVEIEIDRQRAYNFGVSVSTVAREIKAALEGSVATTYREKGADYSVYVMLRPEDRQNVIDLERIYVNGSKGPVCVANVASVVKGMGPISIRHENRNRIVHVTANLLTEMNANVAEDQIKEAISNTFIMPDGVTLSYEGSWKETTSQMGTYGLIILMAILLVFGVMAATYESFKAPLINMTTIPFLIIGVVLICKVTGQAISILSAIGLIMLVGIVVNNGIILVDYTNLLVDRGVELKEACYQSGKSRLRPVLMTTFTTILGMLPMCFASGNGTAAMIQPIGVTVVGGLISSTFITLFFIPVLYSLVMKKRKSGVKSIVVKSLETSESN